MGRAERRAKEKMLKKKLTSEQYEDIKSSTNREWLDAERERFIANFVEVFIPAMREHKISEDRARKIIQDIHAKAIEKFENGDPGLPREVI